MTLRAEELKMAPLKTILALQKELNLMIRPESRVCYILGASSKLSIARSKLKREIRDTRRLAILGRFLVVRNAIGTCS